jgi:hypothetical protein
MRGTHEHSRITVIMGGPNKSGHDDKKRARRASLHPLAFLAFLAVKQAAQPHAQA